MTPKLRKMPVLFLLFDNQLPDAETLCRYRTLVLPGAAPFRVLTPNAWPGGSRQGGRLITTAQTGAHDAWGEPHAQSLLAELLGIDPPRESSVTRGEGAVTHLPADPGLAWTRRRDAAVARQ